MKTKLKTKLIISYTALSILLISSIFLISNIFIANEFSKYVGSNQTEQINNYVNLVESHLDSNTNQDHRDERYLEQIAENALEDGFILGVLDNNRREIFSMHERSVDACSTKMKNMMHNSRRGMHGLITGNQTQYTEEEIQLLSTTGEELGTLIVGFQGPFFLNDADLRFIQMINNSFLITALVFLVFAISLGYYMAGRMAKPISMVTSKTKEIELGNYDGTINMRSSTAEIQDLINAVNTLKTSLKTQTDSKKRLAQDYAHEFRTPLTTLQNNIEGLIDGVFEPSEERLESIREEILRLSRMVSQITNLVDLENNSNTLVKSEFRLDQLIKQTVESYQADAIKKGIELNSDLESTTIYADKDKIKSVIINLLSNAIKYTEKGHVKLQLSSNENQIIFKVKDSGIGISKEDIPHVFEYLYRTDHSRSRGTGGTGIGLTVVKTIIEAHGGSITLESSINEFSEFTIKLPK